MPEIKVNIRFDVEGTDAFNGAFVKSVKTLDEVHSLAKKIAGAKFGNFEGLGKVTPELKKAAALVDRMVGSLIKSKGLTGKTGALMLSGLEGVVSKNEFGQFGIKGKQTKRTTELQGGQGQLVFAQELQRNINNAYAKTLRQFQMAMSKIPAEVDSAGFASSTIKEIRNSQATILRMYRSATQNTEGMTTNAGNEIKQAIQELHAKIFGGISSFVSRATTSQTGAENLGVKIRDFKDRLAAELDMVSKATGGRVPESVEKIKVEYDQFLASKELEINEERKKGALTKSMANQYMNELKLAHEIRIKAIRAATDVELSSRKMTARGAGVDYNVEKMYEDGFTRLRERIAVVTTGIKIDPAMANELGMAVSAKIQALKQALVIEYDKLKAETGGIATGTAQKEMKTKIDAGLAEITSFITTTVAKVKNSGNLFSNLSVEIDKFRSNLQITVTRASEAFGGSTPENIKKIQADFENWLNKIITEIQKLSSTGALTKEMGAKLTNEIDQVYAKASDDIKKIGSVQNAANKKALADIVRNGKQQLALEDAIAKAKANAANYVKNAITRQIDSLKIEGATANVLKKPVINNAIETLQAMINSLTEQIQTATPKTREDVAKLIQSIREQVSAGIANVKVKKQQAPGTAIGGILFNRASMQSFAAVIGHMMTVIGDQISKFAESTRLRGQLTAGISDMFMSAFMASKFFIFAEIAKIAGGVIEIFINLLTELPRQLLALVGGLISSIGGALKAGLATTMYLAMTGAMAAASAGMTAGLSILVGIVVGGLMAIQALLKGLGNFITSFLSSIFQVIYSIVKAGVMIVASVIKSVTEVIKASFNGLYEGLKTATTQFVEFMKTSFDMLGQFMKQSVQEYASQVEFATRAYKETVGVAGQSLVAFQRLMLALRTGFAFKKEDAGEAVFDVVSSGFRNIAEAQKLTAASATLAVASTSDLATATNAMLTAWQNFSGEGETIDSIMRTIAASTTLGRMTMQELGNSMKSVMGLASKVKMSFQDTMMSLAMMTRVFGRGSIDEGARYFNRFLEAIYMPSTRASKTVQSLGVNVEKLGKGTMTEGIFEIVDKLKNLELRDVNKIFTTIQSRRAWLGLTKDVKQFKDMMKDMGTISEGVGWQLEQMMNTPERIMGRLRESFAVFQFIVGEQLWKVIVDGMKGLVSWTQKMLDLMQSDRIRKFFSEFTKWMTPIVNTVFAPLLGFLDKIYLFLNRGFGNGNDFSRIFKTDTAMRLQKTIINVIENVKSLFLYLMNIVKNSALVISSWSKIRDIIGEIFKYFESTSWKNWMADVLNIGYKIKEMISNIFMGTDIGWFTKIVEEIYNVVVKAIQSIINIFQLLMVPAFDRMMALVGVKLKNSMIRGFSEALDFMASKIGGTGLLGGFGEQLKKIVMDINGMIGNKKRVQYVTISSKGMESGWRDIVQGALKAASGVGTGHPGRNIVGGELLTRFEGIAKIFGGISKGMAHDVGLPIMAKGLLSAKTEEETAQLNEIISKYAPAILDVLEKIPWNANLEGNERFGYNVGINKAVVELKSLLTRGGLRGKGENLGMAANLFDILVTQLSNVASPTFRKQVGISNEQYSTSGIEPLLNLFTAMVTDYNDRIESMTYVTGDLANTMPKVKDELVNFAKQLGMSTVEISKLISTQWKGIKTPFSPQQFQDVVSGGEFKKSMTAQENYKQYEALSSELERLNEKIGQSDKNQANMLIGRILDILYSLESSGVKLSREVTQEGIKDFKAGLGPGQDFATEFLKQFDLDKALTDVSRGTPGSAMVDTFIEAKNKGSEYKYYRDMLVEQEKLRSKADEISKKIGEMTKRYGTPEEIEKSAQQEREKNDLIDIKNRSDESLQEEYRKLMAIGRMKYNTEGGKFVEKELDPEIVKREAEYKRRKQEYEGMYGVGSATRPPGKNPRMDFRQWQAKNYPDVLNAPPIRGGNVGGADRLNKRIGELKEEAAYRMGKKKIQEETATNIENAATPELKETARLEGEAKLRELELKRITDEKIALQKKMDADTAGGGSPLKTDVKRMADLTAQETEIKKQENNAQIVENEKKAVAQKNANADAANLAILNIDKNATKQLEVLKINTELVGQCGRHLNALSSTTKFNTSFFGWEDYFKKKVSEVA